MSLLRILIVFLLLYKTNCCFSFLWKTETVATSTTSKTKSPSISFSPLSTLTKTSFHIKNKENTSTIKNNIKEFTTSLPGTFSSNMKPTKQQTIIDGNTKPFSKTTTINSFQSENNQNYTSENLQDFSSSSFIINRLASNRITSENSQFTNPYTKSKSTFDSINSVSTENNENVNVSSTQLSLTDQTVQYTSNSNDSFFSTEKVTNSKSEFSFSTYLLTNSSSSNPTVITTELTKEIFPTTEKHTAMSTKNINEQTTLKTETPNTKSVETTPEDKTPLKSTKTTRITTDYTKVTIPSTDKDTSISTKNRNEESSVRTETPKTISIGTTNENKIPVSTANTNYMSDCPYVSDILIYSLSGFTAIMGIITFVLIIIVMKINKPTISNYSANTFGFQIEESKNL